MGRSGPLLYYTHFQKSNAGRKSRPTTTRTRCLSYPAARACERIATGPDLNNSQSLPELKFKPARFRLHVQSRAPPIDHGHDQRLSLEQPVASRSAMPPPEPSQSRIAQSRAAPRIASSLLHHPPPTPSASIPRIREHTSTAPTRTRKSCCALP